MKGHSRQDTPRPRPKSSGTRPESPRGYRALQEVTGILPVPGNGTLAQGLRAAQFPTKT